MSEYKRLNRILENINNAKIGEEYKVVTRRQAEELFREGVLEVFDKLAEYNAGYINITELKKYFEVE